MRVRRMGATALAVVLAVGLAACGDDGGDDEGVALEDVAGDGGDAAGIVEEGSDAEDEGDPAGDSGSGEDTAEEIAGNLFAEGCGQFLQVFSAFGAALGGGTVDEEAQALFEEALDDAPEDIRDDLEVFNEAYGEFAEALLDAGFDPDDPNGFDPSNPEALEVFSDASSIFQDPAFLEASQNITEFTEAGCPT